MNLDGCMDGCLFEPACMNLDGCKGQVECLSRGPEPKKPSCPRGIGDPFLPRPRPRANETGLPPRNLKTRARIENVRERHRIGPARKKATGTKVNRCGGARCPARLRVVPRPELLSLAFGVRSGEPCWLYPINIGAPHADGRAEQPSRVTARQSREPGPQGSQTAPPGRRACSVETGLYQTPWDRCLRAETGVKGEAT